LPQRTSPHSNGLSIAFIRILVSKDFRRVKRFYIAALAVAFGLAAPRAFAQSTPTPAPLDRIEILGRLAAGYSPSYVAYLVKTRGVAFSVSAMFLDQVARAGGRGVLVDNLPHATSPDAGNSMDGQDVPSDHLAKCAELNHLGDMDDSRSECRASMGENPNSPWPIRAMLYALELVSSESRQDFRQPDAAIEKEATDLQRRLARWPAARVLRPRDAFLAGSPLSPEVLEGTETNDAWSTPDGLVDFLYATPGDGQDSSETIDGPSPATGQMLDQIRDQLIQTVQSAPDLASSHLTLGSFYASQLHDFDKARAEELEAIRLEPDAERGHVSLASLYLSRQDFVDSVAELREAVRIAPQGVFEHLALANMLEQAGYDADAIGELQAILARRPNHSVASERLVDLYVQQKDFESAIEELRRSLKSTSLLFSDESLFVSQRWDDETRLAQLLKLNHDLDDAAEQYLYLLRFRPDDPDLHNGYGMLLAQQNRCADAIGEFNQSVRLSDAQNDSSYARSNVALCLSTQKDYDSAARELSSILESEPNSPIAENNVAWVYATADDPKLRNPAEALRLARLAVDSSDRPEAFMLDTLAEALLLNGKPGEALATETRAVNLDPGNPELQSRLARFRDAATKSSRSNPVSAIAPQPTATPAH
jgi:tetratricopeptide (TPR) repeat protein